VSEDADSLPPDNSLPLTDWSDEHRADSDFRTGTHLSGSQQSEMRKLLSSFSDVFSTELGCTDVLKRKKELDDYKPCVSRPYKLPQSGDHRKFVRFLLPMVPVKKNSDEIRITVNLSRLNAKK